VHQTLATDAEFYKSLDALIADGLQLTLDEFLPSQSTETCSSSQPRHAADILLTKTRLKTCYKLFEFIKLQALLFDRQLFI